MVNMLIVDYSVLTARAEAAENKRVIGEGADDAKIIDEARLDKNFTDLMFNVLKKRGE